MLASGSKARGRFVSEIWRREGGAFVEPSRRNQWQASANRPAAETAENLDTYALAAICIAFQAISRRGLPAARDELGCDRSAPGGARALRHREDEEHDPLRARSAASSRARQKAREGADRGKRAPTT